MSISKNTIFSLGLSIPLCFHAQATLVDESKPILHATSTFSTPLSTPDSNDEIWADMDSVGSGTDELYKALLGQPKATHLSLPTRSLGDDVLGMLSNFPHFQHLYLKENCFTDKSAIHLKNFRCLKEIDLSRNYITSAGLHSLPLEQIEVLGLNFLQVNDKAFLERLSAAPRLKELYVAGASLDESNTEILVRSSSLKRLDISYNNFEKKTIQKLQELNPSLYIINNS
jgi:Leucine-rich repeat (LRR) protein